MADFRPALTDCRDIPIVCCFMQANAEDAVKQMLIQFSEEQSLPEVGTVIAEDQMDDGTPIRVGLLSSCIITLRPGEGCIRAHASQEDIRAGARKA